MLPTGSGQDTKMVRPASAAFSFRYFAAPEMVPPVPIPPTSASSRPSVCSQISGPVVR